MSEKKEPFNRLERAVIERLLEGGPPIVEQLRQQAGTAVVGRREFTGVGFFTDIVVAPDVPRAKMASRAHLSDVDAQIAGLRNGAGFVLFLKDGVVDRLEGFTYDEPWPDRIDEFTLSYRKLPRDFSALLVR